MVKGVSPDDMKTIMEALASQQVAYTAIAREIVDARLADMEDRILRRFAEDESTRREAFQEPDFQYLLTRAQHAQARSGDPEIAETLVEMIAQRSKETTRSRLALSLNQAVERASTLTTNEFAELSLIFIFRYTVRNGLKNLPEFHGYLNSIFDPFIDDVSLEDSSYAYLEAQGCATRSIAGTGLDEILKANYPGFLSNGFERDQVSDVLSDDQISNRAILLPCLNDPTKLQANGINKEVFSEIALKNGLSDEQVEKVWGVHQRSLMGVDDMVRQFGPHVPKIAEAFRVWSEAGIGHITLTSVGIAIGYTNSVRLTDFKADLHIWIK